MNEAPFAPQAGTIGCRIGFSVGSRQRRSGLRNRPRRASRNALFLCKAIGVPLPKAAAKIMAGGTLPTKGKVFISVRETDRPNVIDLMKNEDMALVINTLRRKNPREDEVKIRTAAMQNRIPIMTTLRGADAALRAIKTLQGDEGQVRASRDYHH